MALFIFNYRNLNSNYIYIVYSAIFLFFFFVSFGINIISKEIYLKNIFYSKDNEPIGYRQSFIRQIFCYLLILILSYIFYKFESNDIRESFISSNKGDNISFRLGIEYKESKYIFYSKNFFLHLLFIVLL